MGALMGDDGVCELNRSDGRLASEDRRAGATWAEDQRVQLTGPERETDRSQKAETQKKKQKFTHGEMTN